MAALGRLYRAATMANVGLRRLFLAAVLLPSAVVVLLAMGQLLAGLGDAVGGRVLQRLAHAGGIAWILVLLTMLYGVAAKQIGIGRGSGCCDLEQEEIDEELKG